MPGLEAALTGAEAEILAGLDEGFRPQAVRHRALVLAAGIPYTFVSGRRGRGQQEALYREYLAKRQAWRDGGEVGPSPRPAARPGRSKHNLGFAWDFSGPRTDAEWARAGELAEAMGLESGHRYNDPGHIEQPDSLASLRGLINIRVAAMLAVMGVAWVISKEG